MGNIIENVAQVTNVPKCLLGEGAITQLPKVIESARLANGRPVLFLVDDFFVLDDHLPQKLGLLKNDVIHFVNTKKEPTTVGIDALKVALLQRLGGEPSAVIGMGGGVTMDTAKALSNLFTNEGKAEQFQGWNLLENPGIFKVAIPTLSGTGAEASRTCVMTNPATGLKLGMNSDFTVFDVVIMDSNLTESVPLELFFINGTDAFFHSMESLEGNKRNPLGDVYAREALRLTIEVLSSDDLKSSENRQKLMISSYLAGTAIAAGMVGIVHPFSAGLSVVLGIPHCLANCVVMRAMEEFYPSHYEIFWNLVEKHDVHIPKGLCSNLSDAEYTALYESTIVHEKPLANALGEDFKTVLTRDRVVGIFKSM